MKRFIREYSIIAIIIIISAILRLYSLSGIPIGFNDDEAAFGYNAYSILKTTKDEWGKTLPFPVFESFGDWKLASYLYLVTLSQFAFGVNEFATRLPSAIFGISAVFSTYLLAKELFKREIALISAFLLAISPWHVAASRNAFESDILIFFLTLSTYFFLKGLNNKKFLTLSFLGFAASLYIYRSSWIFTPLFLTILFLLFKKELSKQKIFLAKNIILFLILALPLLPVIFTFKGQSRFFQESFILGVASRGIVNDVNERRGVCQKRLSNNICKFVYNKYNFYLLTYLNNYIANISPETYYIKGTETGYQSFPERGFFYTFEYPLLIAGLIFLLKNQIRSSYILIAWLLIVPLGPSFTQVGNPGRLNILMPIPQIIASTGLVYIFSLLKNVKLKTIYLSAIAIFIFASLLRLNFDLFFHVPQISARYQRYGYKELFQYLESQESNYKQIIVSRKSDDAKQYIHYLFFTKTDPDLFRNNVTRHRDENGWVIVEKIGNFQFFPTTPDIVSLPEKSLVAVGEHEIQLQIKPIYTIDDPKGDRLFEVYDGDQLKTAKKEYEEELVRLKLINKHPGE